MQLDLRGFVRATTAGVLVTMFAIPQSLMAQAADHLVTPSDLQKAVSEASRSRQQNLATVRDFISSEKAQQALKSAHMNPEQVKRIIKFIMSLLLARTRKILD